MDDDLVRVYSAPSVPDGYIIKGRLESEGIPVMLKGESEGPSGWGPCTSGYPRISKCRRA